MKLTAKDRATLERIARPGYRFSLKNWPPGFEPSEYVAPHYLTGVPFGAALHVRTKTWNATLKRKTAKR